MDENLWDRLDCAVSTLEAARRMGANSEGREESLLTVIQSIVETFGGDGPLAYAELDRQRRNPEE